MKRALVHNPYWDTQGGGERYTAQAVKAMLMGGYAMDVSWRDKDLPKQVRQRYSIIINKAVIRPDHYLAIKKENAWIKYRLMKQYELVFWVSDGSIPWFGGKHNILHFQVPFNQVRGNSLLNRIKLKQHVIVVCNSKFTKRVIDREFKTQSLVIYPPVNQFEAKPKDSYILSVGRFDNTLQNKRHDVLINSFNQLKNDEWQLIVAGGSLHENGEIRKLKSLVRNNRVKIIVNPTYSQLSHLYAKASIYWHAAGYGSDLEAHPEKAEHFGITTVEAMSAGAVPVVFAGGGQKEIVTEGKDGYLWMKPEELIKMTTQLIKSDKLRTKMAQEAKLTSHKFSNEVFENAFNKIIG